ncbi:MAG TPA: hypothetical protein PL025_02000 [Anaerolineaceae bacterium]|jgi:hypothetical protein|nr:hypothetical protein [Anaerolineaceae bacterium]
MTKESDHKHIPSTTLNQKLNWIIFFQLVILALLIASLVIFR